VLGVFGLALEQFNRYRDQNGISISAKLLKSETEKRDSKSIFPFSVAICDRNHPNGISRPEVGVILVVWANVKVPAKRLDHYIEITNHEGLFGSNRGVKVGRGQL